MKTYRLSCGGDWKMSAKFCSSRLPRRMAAQLENTPQPSVKSGVAT